MATTATSLQERATRRAPTRPAFTLASGVELGHAPNRAAKELIALALRDTLPTRFIVTLCTPDGETFTVQSAAPAEPTEIAAARGIVQGILIALAPPDPLAGDVTTARDQWARYQGRSGRAVALWAFSCGEPSCVVTASVRRADQDEAWAQLVALGWHQSAQWGYCCPSCAGRG